ncbi:hypothetical protein ACOSP7_020672 [Xanthoceras sorbifolium]
MSFSVRGWSNVARNGLIILLKQPDSYHPACPVCKMGQKSALHAIWRCQSLNEVRLLCGFMKGFGVLGFFSSVDFFVFYKQLLKVEETEVLCVILWRCWYRRNKFVHSFLLFPSKDVVCWARSFFDDFQLANVSHSRLYTQVRPASLCQPPSPDLYQMNVDAFALSNDSLVGLGVVVCNCSGQVLLAGVKHIRNFCSPHIAYATMVVYGMRLALVSGIGPLMVETDALSLVSILDAGFVPLRKETEE